MISLASERTQAPDMEFLILLKLRFSHNPLFCHQITSHSRRKWGEMWHEDDKINIAFTFTLALTETHDTIQRKIVRICLIIFLNLRNDDRHDGCCPRTITTRIGIALFKKSAEPVICWVYVSNFSPRQQRAEFAWQMPKSKDSDQKHKNWVTGTHAISKHKCV